MRTKPKKNVGLELLIQRFENQFETKENLNYYSFKDFLKAKRKYLKYMMEGSKCETT